MHQPIEFKTQSTGQTQYDTVSTTIRFIPSHELAIISSILIEETEMDEVEYNQTTNAYCAANEPQEGSGVEIEPVDQFETQKYSPAE